MLDTRSDDFEEPRREIEASKPRTKSTKEEKREMMEKIKLMSSELRKTKVDRKTLESKMKELESLGSPTKSPKVGRVMRDDIAIMEFQD